MMRLRPALFVAAALACSAGSAARAQDYPHLKFGNPSRAREDTAARDNYLIARKFFALSYNSDRGAPNWVSWRLVKADLGDAKRVPFFPDQALPRGFTHVVPNDYTGSGFDRGHLCPHGDRASSHEASTSTFVMTTSCRRRRTSTRARGTTWKNTVAVASPGGSTGCTSSPAPPAKAAWGANGRRETIAGGKVTIPEFCWKVILVLPEGDEKDDLDKVYARTRVVAVVMPNDDTVKRCERAGSRRRDGHS
jgi:endonuclease G, mitochondrial